MLYPSIARFGKTPNEVFPLSKPSLFVFLFFDWLFFLNENELFVFLLAKAEQAMDYGKELLKLVEEVIYAN